MTRLSHEERRRQILDAVLRVARRKGFAATTTRDVTSEAGIARGHLHRFFPARGELLAEAFRHAADDDLERLKRTVAAGAGPLERLALFLRDYGPTDDQVVVMWIDAWSESARTPAVATTARALNRAWQQVLAGIIRDGRDASIFTVEDPEEGAWTICALLDGLAIQRVVARTLTADQLLARASQVSEPLLGLPVGTLAACSTNRDRPRGLEPSRASEPQVP